MPGFTLLYTNKTFLFIYNFPCGIHFSTFEHRRALGTPLVVESRSLPMFERVQFSFLCLATGAQKPFEIQCVRSGARDRPGFISYPRRSQARGSHNISPGLHYRFANIFIYFSFYFISFKSWRAVLRPRWPPTNTHGCSCSHREARVQLSYLN